MKNNILVLSAGRRVSLVNAFKKAINDYVIETIQSKEFEKEWKEKEYNVLYR